jgi:hypothetical protein
MYWSFISSCLQALQQVERFRNDHQEVLSERTATPTSQLKFITDAWMQASQPASQRYGIYGGVSHVMLDLFAPVCVGLRLPAHLPLRPALT